MRYSAIFGFLLVLTSSSFATTTIHVPADQSTIQAGINAAANSDTVLVAPGTYIEQFNFNGKSIVVRSEGGPAVTTVMGSSINDASHPTVLIANGEGSGTVLQGFTFRGGPIAVQVNTSATIRQNVMTDQTYASWAALVVEGPAKIINNTICHGANGGIACHSSQATIKNNIVANNNHYGIFDADVAGTPELTYNDVYGNSPDYDNGATAGIGSISVAPAFVDDLNRDYHLAPESPCIDAGDPDSQYDDPDGTRNDMGAIPYLYGAQPFAIYVNVGGETQTNVVGHTPTIYWTVIDSIGTQAAYEMEVGTDTDWTSSEMWTSGTISTPDTFTTYAGASLLDGVTYFLRIRLYNGATWGSWNTATFRMNSIPESPIPDHPVGQTEVFVNNVKLTVQNAGDAEADALTYDFEVFSDLDLTILVYSENDVLETATLTYSGYVSGLAAGNEYWWRARAKDGFEYSAWSSSESFICRGGVVIRVPGDRPTIQAGIDAAVEGDTVLVTPGTYDEQLNFSGKAVVVRSEDGPEVTTVLGSSINSESHPTVWINGGDGIGAVLEGFTLKGGPIAVRVRNGATIKRNVLTDQTYASWAALVVEGPAQIINNTICHGINGGVACHSSQAVITNNIVANNGGYGIYDATDGGTMVVTYSDVFGNSPNYASGAGEGTGSISADPAFFDEPNRYYTLTDESPCIDAGDPDPRYNDSDGTRNDMGAIPFVPATQPYADDINLGSENPDHVVDHTPTIYWTVIDSMGTQEAFEMQVGTDADWTTAEMWATGTVLGADPSTVYAGTPLEDGVTHYLRMRLYDGATWGSWTATVFHVNGAPGPPTPDHPVAQAVVNSEDVRLAVRNVSDAEGDDITYDFEVYSDPALTVLVFSQYDVPETGSVTYSDYVIGLLSGSQYWWRVRAMDGFEYSAWSSTESFLTQGIGTTIRVPGDQPTIQAGIDAASDGDIVLVGPGTYHEQFNFNGKTIVVRSEAGPAVTTVVGSSFNDSNHPTVLIANGEGSGTVLQGFTFRGGPVAIRVNIQATIKDNILTDQTYASWAALVVQGPARIINNTICHGTNGGIACYSYQAVIKNNIVVNNTHYGIIDADGSGTVVGTYNDVYGNSPNYDAGAVAGTGSISADPAFVDEPNRDYHLGAGSPCIDAGDPAPQYDGPDGTRNDIGAIPFAPGIQPLATHINLGAEDLGHVLNHIPTIYWTVSDSVGTQHAYEIEIGTDADWTTAEMWATGAVSSADPSAVYAGTALEDGMTYLLRIRLFNGDTWGSWTTMAFHLNAAPWPPIPDHPVAHAAVHISDVQLAVQNAGDAEADDLIYDFEVFSDSTLNVLVFSDYDVPETGTITTSDHVPGLSGSNEYWWRARAKDDYVYSVWSSTASFITRDAPITIHIPEDQPTIQAGIDATMDWDTVLVGTGTYNEQFSFKGKTIVVRSEAGAGFTTVLGSSSNDQNHPTVLIANGEGAGTVLQGFTFRGGPVAIRVNVAATILQNVLTDQTYAGWAALVVEGPARIVNNTICHGANGGMVSYSNQAVIKNNIIVNNRTYGIHGVATVVATYSDVYGNSPNYASSASAGTGSISANPGFVDEPNRDYQLLLGSPCIDAGDPDPLHNDPDGTRNDMGALTHSAAYPQAVAINVWPDSLTHVVNHQPVFRWLFVDTIGAQSAYSIEVSTTGNWSTPDMWASGELISGDTFAEYNGEPLLDAVTYYLRIKLNNGIAWGGWSMAHFRMNTAPGSPTPKLPLISSVIQTARPILRVDNVADLEDDPRRYSFEVFFDSDLTMPAASVSDVAEGTAVTEWMTDPLTLENHQYWWRARASDGYEYGAWSVVWNFWLNANNDPPGEFALQFPENGEIVPRVKPVFSWNMAIDPDPGASVVYAMLLSSDSQFLFTRQVTGIIVPTYTMTDSLFWNTGYWWKVVAVDQLGDSAWCSQVFAFRTMLCGDANADRTINVGDAVYLVNYLFRTGPGPMPIESGDANGNCEVNIADAVYMIGYIFRGGPPPQVGCAK